MTKTIKNFEEYTINDSGINDESVWSTKTNQFLKSRQLPSGYVQICFSVNGIHHNKYLHVLIAEAFIPNPQNKPTVNHKNHIRSDNRIENLEWATILEQMDEITKSNISKSRIGKHYPKLSEALKGKPSWNKGKSWDTNTVDKISKAKSKTVYCYTLDDELVAIYDNASEAENDGFSKWCIRKCCEGKNKTHKGLKFSYDCIIK